MTTTMLPPLSDQTARLPDSRPKTRQRRPPTEFARRSPASLVEAGDRLARRAIAFVLEDVELHRAVGLLIEEAGRDREVLRMAQDYLSFVSFEIPNRVQVAALFMIEDALNELDRDESRLSTRLSRLVGSLRRRLGSRRGGGRGPDGRPTAPAVVGWPASRLASYRYRLLRHGWLPAAAPTAR